MVIIMGKPFIGIALRSLNNSIMRCVDSSAHKSEIDRITGSNGWIIGYIAENADKDIYQRDLEAHFGITRSTASKNVDLMVQKGLIEKHPVACDARLKKLVLTPKARDVAKRMCIGREKMEEKLTSGFSDEELELLHSYLVRMRENISSCSE